MYTTDEQFEEYHLMGAQLKSPKSAEKTVDKRQSV
jgi:hypothetical protein